MDVKTTFLYELEQRGSSEFAGHFLYTFWNKAYAYEVYNYYEKIIASN